ncbi:MAG: DUF3516 domain-containing protein [Verrucomicrobia bacterium]|nr:DUF3516 domain-containing protein [Verrucomicrobiota bacterium]
MLRLGSASSDAILEAFLEHVTESGLSLYPAQETAILEVLERKNVILNTPTGSGKSLVAAATHFFSAAQGRRSVYTCPIKALVNEKFLALCRDFGPQNVGMATGDATVNRDAPILCCTAEILANLALRHGVRTGFSEVIMDEFHYYSDRDRGSAWQIPLLTMANARFLLMSATLGDTDFFARDLERLTGAQTAVVKSATRPVPLTFDYSEVPLNEAVEQMVQSGKAPVYIVHFSQNEAVQSAQDFMSLNFCSREEKQAIAAAMSGTRFTTPFGKDLQKYLRHGVGVHHAGLLPKYRILVEQLAQKGMLKIICGTDTLGVGVNVPIRTVLFTKLCKFDGQKTGILNVRDFHQVAGRAGRRGFDSEGWVVAQAPEHIIENKRLAEKAERTGKKNLVKRKPPEQNYVGWDDKTYARLQSASPEPLVSRFQVSHGMLLNVLSREEEDGCRAMQQLIRDSHETPKAKAAHRARAWQLFRALLDRKIIEWRTDSGSANKLRLNVELQEDFSLNHALGLYLLDTVKLMDPAAADYALVVVTLAESILEDPDIILRRQLDKLKTQRLAELKEQGMEYEERMAELEKMEHPKPNRDFIYSTFNDFVANHPWVGQENIRPKTVAREMYENVRSFNDYVKDYELNRSEGVLLRHLSSVHKVLAHTLPEEAKTEAVRDIEAFLDTMLRQADSSLLDEWERLQDLDGSNAARRLAETEAAAAAAAERARKAQDITSNEAEFLRRIRQTVFGLLGAVVAQDWESALGWLDSDESATGVQWSERTLKEIFEKHSAERGRFMLDPEARNSRHTYVVKDDSGSTWKVEQMLLDPEGANDWAVTFLVDLRRSREARKPFLTLDKVGPIAS